MAENEQEGILVREPVEISDRSRLARACQERLNLSIPCVVDTIENRVDSLYAGWPERIFVLDGSGTVVYAGGMGPWGFDPQEARQAVIDLR